MYITKLMLYDITKLILYGYILLMLSFISFFIFDYVQLKIKLQSNKKQANIHKEVGFKFTKRL